MERRYPDPDKVPYARLHPVGNPCQITSQVTGKMFPMHKHGAWIDENGDGNTDVDAGHYHRVKNFRVLPDESDGHTHDLTGLPCGAGAPNLQVASPGERAMMMRGPNGEQYIQMMGAPAPGVSWGWIIGGVVLAAAVTAGLYFFLKAGTQTYGFPSKKKARAFLRRYNAAMRLVGKRTAKLACER